MMVQACAHMRPVCPRLAVARAAAEGVRAEGGAGPVAAVAVAEAALEALSAELMDGSIRLGAQCLF